MRPRTSRVLGLRPPRAGALLKPASRAWGRDGPFLAATPEQLARKRWDHSRSHATSAKSQRRGWLVLPFSPLLGSPPVCRMGVTAETPLTGFPLKSAYVLSGRTL